MCVQIKYRRAALAMIDGHCEPLLFEGEATCYFSFCSF